MSGKAPLQLAYLSGPADALRFLAELENGASDYFGTNYMKQFLLFTDQVNADAFIVTWHGDEDFDRRIGRYRIRNKPLPRANGISYHVAMLRWHLAILAQLWRVGPDVAVVTGNQDYWWMLAPLRLRGTRFVASYHSVLWPRCEPRRRRFFLFSALNGWLLLRGMPAIVTTSAAIRQQVERVLGVGRRRPVLLNHLPTYRPEQFEGIASPLAVPRVPFEVVFTGRIERDKGVFDLVAVAEHLERVRPGEFRYHLCGEGTQRAALIDRVAAAGLERVVAVHGHCGPDRIRQLMSRAHAAVTPTRTEFSAGFEMTCAEAILSGRPLVTSAVAPALDYLHPAAIEVTPNDVADYAAALLRLRDDTALYERMCRACDDLKAQFYDERNSWRTAMLAALDVAVPGAVRSQSHDAGASA